MLRSATQYGYNASPYVAGSYASPAASNHKPELNRDPSISVKKRHKSLSANNFTLQMTCEVISPPYFSTASNKYSWMRGFHEIHAQRYNLPFAMNSGEGKKIFNPPYVFASRKTYSRRRRFLTKSTLTPTFHQIIDNLVRGRRRTRGCMDFRKSTRVSYRQQTT